MADKYFPGEDPLGKVMNINHEYDFTVTGVMNDVPHNSMLRFEMLIPFQIFEDQYRKEGRTFEWFSNHPRTYLLLRDASLGDVVRSKIKNYVRDKAGDERAPEFTTIPLKSYRFSPWGGGPRRIKRLTFISTVAFLILLIACVNFMNLSTARSATRAKEIGMRKVVGAGRKHMIIQFLGESFILSFAAMFLAMILVILLLPAYNEIFGIQIPISIITKSYVIPVWFGIALLTGFISGSYPAFFLSSFKPVTTLKGEFRSGAKSALIRKGLVVFQFVLSLSLIIGTAVIYKQIHFVREKDMGFDTDHIVYIPLRGGSSEFYPALRTRLSACPGIVSVTASFHKPTWIGSNTTRIKWEGKDSEYNTLIHVTSVDYDYVSTLNMEMLAGRDFSKEFPSDRENSFLINERLFQDMNKDNILGAVLEFGPVTGRIIGVVKDFHFIPVNDKVPPLVISLLSRKPRYVMVRVLPGNISSTLSSIREAWESVIPAYPFECNFFDEEFERSYRVETRLAGMVKSYAVIGICIACLGLFGLASFTAEQRTKEIGIRKILGASVLCVAGRFSKEFLVLVFVSTSVSWPLSFYMMNKWLRSFAYRTNISLWTLVIPAFLTLVLTLLTVSYQTVKAARANPVDSLRYE